MKRLTLSYGVEPGPRRTLSLPLGRANLMLGLLVAATVWSVVTALSLATGVLHWGDAPTDSAARAGVRSAGVAGVAAVTGAAGASLATDEATSAVVPTDGDAGALVSEREGVNAEAPSDAARAATLGAAAPAQLASAQRTASEGAAEQGTAAQGAATQGTAEQAAAQGAAAQGAAAQGAVARAAAAAAALDRLSPAAAAEKVSRPLPAGRVAVATAAQTETETSPAERLGESEATLDGTAPGARLAAALAAFRASPADQRLAVQFVVENRGKAPIAGTIEGEADFHHADGHVETVKATVSFKARQRSPKRLAFVAPAEGGEFTSVRLVVRDEKSGRVLKSAYPVGSL